MTAGTPQQGAPGTTRVRLGELLVKAGVISDVQLKAALQEQKQWGGKLGDILVRLKYVSEDIFVRALSKQLGLARADLNASIPLEALARIPSEVAEEYEIVPTALSDDGRTLFIATADPLNLTVVDYVRTITKCRVVPQVASASAIRAAIARLYQIDVDASLRIVNNADDSAFGHSAVPPPVSGLELNPRTATNPNIVRPHNATNGNLGPASRPPVPQTAMNYTPAVGVPPLGAMPHNAGGYYQTGLPSPSYEMPGYPAYPNPGPYAVPTQPAVVPYPGQVPPNQAAMDDASRREVVALKALVELLVQKGVISLDEYLARLKRS